MHPYSETARSTGERTLTVILPDGPLVVNGDHPQYDEILVGAREGTDAQELRNLSDLSVAVGQKFQSLTERVKVSGGTVFFDGDAIDSRLTDHIVRALDEGSDFMPLVRFYEKLAANPNAHSREQLYDWLDRREFTIAPDGDFLAYKGCAGTPDAPVSQHRGLGIVNGEQVNGQVPNPIGAVVEYPRSRVAWDPSQGCAQGLHAGSYDYAKQYASGVLLLVKVNPRDVVSVPTDSDWAKIRTSRYEVVDAYTAPEPIQTAVWSSDPEDLDDWDQGEYYDEDSDYEDGCGDPDCEYC